MKTFLFPFIISLFFLLSSCGGFDRSRAYRLGDMVKSKEFRKEEAGYPYHKEYFPDSVAVEYMDKTQEANDFDTLYGIIHSEKRKKETPVLEYDKLLIIHLRTGDVIQGTIYTVEDYLSRYIIHVNGYHYVKPLPYYEKIINEIPSKVSKVQIISGFHIHEKTYDKSLKFIQKIENFFKDKGFETLPSRIDYPADEDFLLMSNAKYFVPSGGGFSSLIGEMVKKNGGILFPK